MASFQPILEKKKKEKVMLSQPRKAELWFFDALETWARPIGLLTG